MGLQKHSAKITKENKQRSGLRERSSFSPGVRETRAVDTFGSLRFAFGKRRRTLGSGSAVAARRRSYEDYEL